MPPCYNLRMVTEILRPETVQEALKARALPGSAFLGGGTWLNASYSAEPITLISLEKLGLDSIEPGGKRCVIGATATFQRIVDHPGLPAAVRRAAGLTASRTLRNMMTMGGEIALHPADSAIIPILVAMGAEVLFAGKKKPVPIYAFLSDRDSGLVLAVTIPEPLRPSAVLAVSRTSHSPRSLVVAATAASLRPKVSGLRVFVSDCRAGPVRLTRLEELLEGQPLPSRAEIEGMSFEFAPLADMQASSRYKLYMTKVLAADALHQMRGDAQGAA